jgi:hypothetical protein
VLKKALWRNYKNNLERSCKKVEKGARKIEKATKICKHFASII